mmetsp:Transcript_44486/g.140359  ORF Transcript_44486/g.140359 Transcript_44486/m.140359 type:complete len:218 (+) Transcript_44486:295-948(+)
MWFQGRAWLSPVSLPLCDEQQRIAVVSCRSTFKGRTSSRGRRSRRRTDSVAQHRNELEVRERKSLQTCCLPPSNCSRSPSSRSKLVLSLSPRFDFSPPRPANFEHFPGADISNEADFSPSQPRSFSLRGQHDPREETQERGARSFCGGSKSEEGSVRKASQRCDPTCERKQTKTRSRFSACAARGVGRQQGHQQEHSLHSSCRLRAGARAEHPRTRC